MIVPGNVFQLFSVLSGCSVSDTTKCARTVFEAQESVLQWACSSAQVDYASHIDPCGDLISHCFKADGLVMLKVLDMACEDQIVVYRDGKALFHSPTDSRSSFVRHVMMISDTQFMLLEGPPLGSFIL
jgi:hypothetical protein